MPLTEIFKLFAGFTTDWKAAEAFLEQERQAAERAAKREDQRKAAEAKKQAAEAKHAAAAPAAEQKVLDVGGGEGGALVDKVCRTVCHGLKIPQTLQGLQGNDARALMKMVQDRQRKPTAAAATARESTTVSFRP